MVRILMPALAILLIAAACGEPQKTGSEKLLEFEEQENKKRLGEKESPSPDAPTELVLGKESPSPSPSPPPPVEHFFDVSLTADSPYFQPGNALLIQAGVTLRVTNKDATSERPTRSFTAKDGSFDSGPLAFGKVWTQKFDNAGFWDIIDSNAPFILATLEVR